MTYLLTDKELLDYVTGRMEKEDNLNSAIL